jgi:glutaconate CoA-transferase, subunit A
LAKDDELYKTYLDEYIYRIRDHAAFIELIGVENFKRIQANPTSGYATGLNREV